MRKLIAFLVPVVLILWPSAGNGQTYNGSGSYMAAGGGGAAKPPRVTATLNYDAGAPVIRATVDIGIASSAALSARLIGKFPWLDNDEAWAIVAEDTSSAVASGKHWLSSDLDWTGYTGDLIEYELRVYTAEGLAYSTGLDTLTLDAPGDLYVAMIASTLDPWVDDGTLPAIADTADYFDLVLLDEDYMRYALIEEGTGGLMTTPSYSMQNRTQSLYNSSPYESADQAILWFHQGFLEHGDEIVYSAIFAVDNGNGTTNLESYGRFVMARLDTAVADTMWHRAPAVAGDARRRQVSWDYMDLSDTTGTKWTPTLYQRDDMFDCGIASARRYGNIGIGEAIVIDVTDADQAVLDGNLPNNGYWLFCGDPDDGTRHNIGWDLELGAGANIDAQPCKIVMWAEGTNRTLPWGVGNHRLPLVASWDDAYDEQEDYFNAWGAEDATLIIARGNLNPMYSGADSVRIWNTYVDSLWQNGLDIVLSNKTAATFGATVSGSGEAAGFDLIARDWLHDLLPTSYPDSTAALADTSDTEWTDYAWNGGATPALMQCIRMLQEAGYRSARGYSGMVADTEIGSGTRLMWDDHFNAYHIYPDSWGVVPDALTEADALEELLELVDQAIYDGRHALIWWAHSDNEVIISGEDHADAVAKVTAYRAAAESAPVDLMTLEEAITLRLNGQSPVDPSPDDTPANWLPATSGIDTVWARVEPYVDRCWYPPYRR